MTDHWMAHLSEYLDGDLALPERRALEHHLGTCAGCRDTLAGLRAVKERAGALVDPPAPDDLWAGIVERIGTAGSTSAGAPTIVPLRVRRAQWPWPALAAVAAAVAVVAITLLVARGRADRPVALLPSDTANADGTRLATFDAEQVDGEIAQLQHALDRGRGRLDPATVAVLEKNLKVIREATADARAALARDPANRELQDYFAATVHSKLALMRRATAMAGV
jgi:anti-sigma-K factor RskA